MKLQEFFEVIGHHSPCILILSDNSEEKTNIDPQISVIIESLDPGYIMFNEPISAIIYLKDPRYVIGNHPDRWYFSSIRTGLSNNQMDILRLIISEILFSVENKLIDMNVLSIHSNDND